MKIVKNILPLGEFHKPKRPYMPLSEEQKLYVSRFNRQISSGEVELEEVTCICGSEDFYLVARFDRYSISQDTVMCAKCGLVMSNPRMTDTEYEKFYRDDTYRKCYETDDFFKTCGKKYTSDTGRQIFDTVVKVKPANRIKRVLEFGAGGGWNLIAFKEKGIDVTGYDYSSGLVSLGREHDLNLFQGGINDIEGRFDVIILNHIIEHFTDPLKSVRKIKEHLEDDGVFYIAVPDIKNFSMGQLQNAHTFYFTKETLEYYIAKCGLKLVRCEPAEKIHLAGIFINEPREPDTDSLKKHKEAMLKVFRRFYVGESLGNIFQTLGLKKAMKRFARSRAGLKIKRMLYE